MIDIDKFYVELYNRFGTDIAPKILEFFNEWEIKEVNQNPPEPDKSEVDNAVREVRQVFEASNMINKTVRFVSVCAVLAIVLVLAMVILQKCSML